MHTENRTHFLSSRYARAGTAILVLQAALFYAASRGERIPSSQPLDRFPDRAGEWRTVQRGVIEKEVQQVLRADDTLSRVYSSPAAPSAIFSGRFLQDILRGVSPGLMFVRREAETSARRMFCAFWESDGAIRFSRSMSLKASPRFGLRFSW